MTETYDYWLNKAHTKYNYTDDGALDFVIFNTFVSFYSNSGNARHRINGPAKIYKDGVCEWFINGKLVATKYHNHWKGEFYDWTIEQGIDIDNLTDEDKTLIKMVWG